MNLSWIQFALHILNIIVLYILIRYLLYKPVAKFMRNRKASYEGELQEIKDRELSVEEREEESNRFLKESQTKAQRMAEDEIEAVQVRAKTIIEDANAEAQRIIVQARHEIEEERRVTREALIVEAAEMAVKIAEKLVARSFTDEDNKNFIEKCLLEGTPND